jgi:hypothetical protein
MLNDFLHAIREFLYDNSNKLMVLGVFLVLLLAAYHMCMLLGRPGQEKFAEFAIQKSGEAFAAFLGLVTGVALGRAMNGNNGNGNGKTPAPEPQLPSQTAITAASPATS